jgi:hypothetical protein
MFFSQHLLLILKKYVDHNFDLPNQLVVLECGRQSQGFSTLTEIHDVHSCETSTAMPFVLAVRLPVLILLKSGLETEFVISAVWVSDRGPLGRELWIFAKVVEQLLENKLCNDNT